MAGARRRNRPALIETLFAEPHRFDFFQAAMLLERVSCGRTRFRAEQTRAFPCTEIAGLTQRDGVVTLAATFLGLTGASGVLPLHYTDTVIQATRRKNLALRDFLDVFNHRAIELFLRAWQKYRLPAAHILTPAGETDPITEALFSLIGFGTSKLRDRLSSDDHTLVHFSGFLSRQVRSAVGLEATLSEVLGQPVGLEQFRGGWLQVHPTEQTRLPGPGEPEGRFCRLGVDAVVGDRVWDVQGAFRLKVGPTSYDQFMRFLPNGRSLERIAELTRLYVGPALSFDVQVILTRDEVPECQLGAGGLHAPRLGWNIWLKGAAFTRDAEDAVFDLDRTFDDRPTTVESA